MLYSTLIKKIVKFTEDSPNDAGAQTIKALAKVQNISVEDYINLYAVQDIGRIRNIAANSFPKVLRQGPIVAEMNIHHAWRVVPMLRAGRAFKNMNNRLSAGKAVIL